VRAPEAEEDEEGEGDDREDEDSAHDGFQVLGGLEVDRIALEGDLLGEGDDCVEEDSGGIAEMEEVVCVHGGHVVGVHVLLDSHG
jgi:hypothetical protein